MTTITIDQMIQREVNCCLSSLVSTLAQGWQGIEAIEFRNGRSKDGTMLRDLAEQAFELACPIPDYEEAAREAGWEPYLDKYNVACWRTGDSAQDSTFAGSVEDLCDAEGIEPYDREVFEHWSVSNWLAEKLIAQGEKVDTDFAAMNVWARTCTGQGIASDTCIQNIYNAMVA